MKMSCILAAGAALAALLSAPMALAEPPAPDAAPKGELAAAPTAPSAEDEAAREKKRLEEAQKFYDSLDRKTGDVAIVKGKVHLSIPQTHYFVGAADARRILVNTWGNPPESAENVEGMIFPKDGNPALDTWGAIVEYQSDGHVSDDDAAKIDYSKLLKDMQEEARAANAERQKQGYPAVELVGWAEPPHYDSQTKKLYWAKALQFSDVKDQTLNYDIRVLGRDGVLVMSFIAGMRDLDAIRTAAPTVLAMPEFNSGARYGDFNPKVDKKAAYGVAGLIAGGAALALAKKAGLLGLILAFGKKFIVLIGVAAAAVGRFFSGLFGKKKSPE